MLFGISKTGQRSVSVQVTITVTILVNVTITATFTVPVTVIFTLLIPEQQMKSAQCRRQGRAYRR